MKTAHNAPRRAFLARTALGAACAMTVPGLALAAGDTKDKAATPGNPLDALTALETRRSVRAYTHEPVSDKDLDTVLAAAQLAPSAANEQPWDFVVIRDPKTLAKVGDINPYAAFAAKAPAAILVCLDTEKEDIPGMGILDVAMSAENLLLAAHGIGLGAVFTGVYPMVDRMEGFSKLLDMPENIIPVGLVVLGHPAIPGLRTAEDRVKPENVHWENWAGKRK
ncbi:nitroreductase family protein [Desulfovibrio sp.]|uniref:nitroreductase family protein n=1 Tax=Desulfovibrio sp. TaxID=885 RepID=UPI00262EE13B|nr:nitroreductase family protein [Desulfovibrio sp.]